MLTEVASYTYSERVVRARGVFFAWFKWHQPPFDLMFVILMSTNPFVLIVACFSATDTPELVFKFSDAKEDFQVVGVVDTANPRVRSVVAWRQLTKHLHRMPLICTLDSTCGEDEFCDTSTHFCKKGSRTLQPPLAFPTPPPNCTSSTYTFNPPTAPPASPPVKIPALIDPPRSQPPTPQPEVMPVEPVTPPSIAKPPESTPTLLPIEQPLSPSKEQSSSNQNSSILFVPLVITLAILSVTALIMAIILTVMICLDKRQKHISRPPQRYK